MYKGLTYEEWSLVIQRIGYIIVFIVSIIMHKYKPAYVFAVIFMSAVNIAAQQKIAHDGPGTCVGFFFFPLTGVIVAAIGVSLHKLLFWVVSKITKSRKNRL